MSNHLDNLDIKEYLQKALQFLLKHEWIYNYPNTHVLVNKVFENIEQDWIEHLKNLDITNLKDFQLKVVKVRIYLVGHN